MALAAVALGVHELAVLAASGTGLALLAATSRRGPGSAVATIAIAAGATATGRAATLAAAVALAGNTAGLWPLFLVFARIGAVLFGSGYVLLAFLRADLVTRLGWLTEQQLLDAISIGQVTPGPLFTTATFIGYILRGPAGAVVATTGIFLPAFFFVAVSGPLVPRLRRSRVAGAALDGVNVASLALMAVVSWQLGRAALVDPLTSGLALVAAVTLARYRINSAWLIAAGACVGWLVEVGR
jgi:chromate transporter